MGRSGRPGRPSKRSSRAKATAGVVRDKVVDTVAGAPKAMAAAEAAARVEVAAGEEAAAAPVVSVVVATAAIAGLLAVVGDAIRGATSGWSAPQSGHEESTYSSDAEVLAMDLPISEEDLAVEAQAFVAKGTDKCRVMDGEEVRGRELGKQVVQYIADSATTCKMTPHVDGYTDYRECSRPFGLANGETTSVEYYGDPTVGFRCDNEWVHVTQHDGVTLRLKGGRTVRFPLIGKLCRQYGYRPDRGEGWEGGRHCMCRDCSWGSESSHHPTDIKTFKCTYGHTHEVLLKKTAEQQGVNLSGELHECRGWSMAKGLRKPVTRLAHLLEQIRHYNR